VRIDARKGRWRRGAATGFMLHFAEQFLAEVQRVPDLSGVEHLLESASRDLGFRHYAMIHHDDARERRPGLIHMQNYPHGYAERYVAERLHRDDPVVHACTAANACFCWSELPRLIRICERHRGFLERGARAGVVDGITVPSFVLGERSGSCNFSGPRDPARVGRFVGVVQIVGSFAFQAARRIVLGGRLREVRAARLQPRQRECVVLAGQGKSNTDIATILGISVATVKSYIEAGCARYAVHNRTQLVIAAILDGEIGIHEIAPRQYRHLAD